VKNFFAVLLFKKIFVLCLIVVLLVHEQVSHAQALPTASFVVNRAVASAVARVAAARGFAANDPKIAATLTGIGQVSTSLNVASTAVGVGMAVAGVPVWMGIAASLGVVALGMGVNAWINGANGEVSQAQISVAATPTGNKLLVDAPAQSLPSYSAPTIIDTAPLWARAVNAGAPIYRSPSECYANEACFALPLPPDQPSFRYTADWQGKTLLATTNVFQFGQWYTFLTQPNLTMPTGVTFTWEFAGVQLFPNSTGGNQITVYINESTSGGDSQGLPSYSRTNTYNNVGQVYGQIGPQYYPDLDQAAAAISPAVKTAKISNDTLARLIDQVWQRAAMDPNYQGVPYSYSQPVTEADVMPWAMENPQAVPTIDDLLSPASNPGTNIVPISPEATPTTDPGSNPNPNPTPGTSNNVNVINTPNVNVTNTVRIDWGDNPDWVPPQSDMPGEIMGSITQLFAPIQRFAVPSHNAECPRPSINLFERTIVMDGHCALLDAVKPTLYAVMTAVWAILAAIIVLTA
jgi:hypothetical protein